jgi:hypothetical protein
MTDVGLTGADPLDITQSGQEPTFPWIRWQKSMEYAAFVLVMVKD